MSSVREVQYDDHMLDTDDHATYDRWSYLFWDTDNDEETSDSSDYDDHNEFFRMSLSSKDPKKLLEKYQPNFVGKEWYPTKFFKKIYLRNFLSKAKSFLAEIEEMDLTEVSRKKSIRNKIVKSRRAIRQAEKYYHKHELKALHHIYDAVDLGKSILEDLHYLNRQGRLD